MRFRALQGALYDEREWMQKDLPCPRGGYLSLDVLVLYSLVASKGLDAHRTILAAPDAVRA